MGNIDIGQTFVRGWELFVRNAIPLVVGTLIAALLSFASAGILLPVLTAGFYVMIRKSWADEDAEIGDIFAGFSNFIPYFLAGLIILALCLIGIILCGVGVVVTLSAVLFIYPLMMEKGLDAGDAMSESFDLYKENWLPLTVFALISYIVESIGELAFGIALLVTFPFAKCMVYVAYKQLVPSEESLTAETKEHSPSEE